MSNTTTTSASALSNPSGLPTPMGPMLDPQGNPHPVWYQFFQNLNTNNSGTIINNNTTVISGTIALSVASSGGVVSKETQLISFTGNVDVSGYGNTLANVNIPRLTVVGNSQVMGGGTAISSSPVTDILFTENVRVYNAGQNVRDQAFVNTSPLTSAAFSNGAEGDGWLYIEYNAPFTPPSWITLGSTLQNINDCRLYFSNANGTIPQIGSLTNGGEGDQVCQILTTPAALAQSFGAALTGGGTSETFSLSLAAGRLYLAVIDQTVRIPITIASVIPFDTTVVSTMSSGTEPHPTGVVYEADITNAGTFAVTISSSSTFGTPGYLGAVLTPNGNSAQLIVDVPPQQWWNNGTLLSDDLLSVTTGPGILAIGTSHAATIESYLQIGSIAAQSLAVAGGLTISGTSPNATLTGGSANISSASANEIAWYAATGNTISGNSFVTLSGTSELDIGKSGTATGAIGLVGSTSGTLILSGPSSGGGTINLPAGLGAAGQVPVIDGAGNWSYGLPSSIIGLGAPISIQTVSGVGTVNFPASGVLTPGYDYYVVGQNVSTSANTTVGVQFGTGAGPTYVTSGYQYGFYNLISGASANSLSAAAIFCFSTVTWSGFTCNFAVTGGIEVAGMHSVQGNLNAVLFGGNYAPGTATAITAFRLVPSSGTISGTFYLYAVARSVSAAYGALYTATPSAPTAPASTSAYTMQGLAGNIKPQTTGRIRFKIIATAIAPSLTTAGNGIIGKIAYGTGTAPANGAAAAGTVAGVAVEATLLTAATAAADVHMPFVNEVEVIGLTVGTTYWFDLQAQAVGTASSVGLTAVYISASEF